MELLNEAIEPDFRRAGWLPGRTVAIDREIPQSHPARQILEEFGGLKIGRVGPGVDQAASDIALGAPPYDDEDVNAWEQLLKTKLVGLGECHNGHGQLWLDDQGRLFLSGLTAPMMLFVGYTFAEGVEALLRGKRLQPMLLPWQTKVMVWGEWFHAGDACVLTRNSFDVR